ncbi:MAG TPA: DoxX family protein [Anaerolineales bacterium]|nr:DoxX family protein [Anaerolineales bacterium]
MDIVLLVGRILVGGYYLYNASNHLFLGTAGLTGYAASKNVPMPKPAVYVAGVLLLIGGLSFLLGYQPIIGTTALVLFFLPVSFKMHDFWAVQDPMAKIGEMVNFTKNMALMGSSLMFLAIPQPWPFSLGG